MGEEHRQLVDGARLSEEVHRLMEEGNWLTGVGHRQLVDGVRLSEAHRLMEEGNWLTWGRNIDS